MPPRLPCKLDNTLQMSPNLRDYLTDLEQTVNLHLSWLPSSLPSSWPFCLYHPCLSTSGLHPHKWGESFVNLLWFCLRISLGEIENLLWTDLCRVLSRVLLPLCFGGHWLAHRVVHKFSCHWHGHWVASVLQPSFSPCHHGSWDRQYCKGAARMTQKKYKQGMKEAHCNVTIAMQNNTIWEVSKSHIQQPHQSIITVNFNLLASIIILGWGHQTTKSR